MIPVGVLVPRLHGTPIPPDRLPLGRAALQLRDEGIAVVFATAAAHGALIGTIAVPGGWEPVTTAVIAAWDRYPSQTDPDGYAALRAGLGDTPIANPPAITALCRDKVACQQVLEAAGVPQPEIAVDPVTFADRLAAWGSGYLKPRYGAFGRGVRRVVPGDPLPATGEGAVPGRTEPMFLQRAIPPLPPWRGVACRVLVQRDGAASWWVGPAVVRRSDSDWVVNAARGAQVVPVEAAFPDLVGRLRFEGARVASALAARPDGDLLVELGIDVVIGADRVPVVVEVNGTPRGRLEVIAAADPRWDAAHVDACARPLRWLAGRRGT